MFEAREEKAKEYMLVHSRKLAETQELLNRERTNNNSDSMRLKVKIKIKSILFSHFDCY